MNQLSSHETLTGIEVHYEEVRTIDAVCINCNKRFTSMRGVTMHLKMTAARHVVNFINYGNHDKKTGLKGSLTKHFSPGILQKAPPLPRSDVISIGKLVRKNDGPEEDGQILSTMIKYAGMKEV
jgi:hypothetical protein